MTTAELLRKHSIELMDITAAIRSMPEGRSLLRFEGSAVQPVYAKHILKLLLLIEWPLVNGQTEIWTRFYAAILPHGKTHVAEIYFVQECLRAFGPPSKT